MNPPPTWGSSSASALPTEETTILQSECERTTPPESTDEVVEHGGSIKTIPDDRGFLLRVDGITYDTYDFF